MTAREEAERASSDRERYESLYGAGEITDEQETMQALMKESLP